MILPIIVEQFLALLVGLADTLMVSHVGEAAVSGVSLVNQLNNVFIMVFTALASGGAVVVSQYIGSRELGRGTQAASQLVMITGLISLLATGIVLLFGRQLFDLLFGQVETDVRESDLTYLRISAYSFGFLALYNACAGLFRSMGRTKILMDVSIIMNAINVIGNAIGVFVLHADVRGVAYPSLISRIFAAIAMLYLTVARGGEICIQTKQIFAWKPRMIARIFHIAIPNSALFCPVGFSVSNGMRAAGDVRFTMYSSIFATVICRTALSVFFGVTLGLGVIGVTLAMVCDWAVKALLVLLRWRSGKWKNFEVI